VKRVKQGLIKLVRHRGWKFVWLKTMIGESNSSCSVCSRPRNDQWHIARITENVDKVKDLEHDDDDDDDDDLALMLLNVF